VQKKAVERLRAGEHPALDVFQRVLEADEAHPELLYHAVRRFLRRRHKVAGSGYARSQSTSSTITENGITSNPDDESRVTSSAARRAALFP
jgi:hypothetical protein